MSDDLLDRVEIDPKGEARGSVIFLHGLGDSGHGWSAFTADFEVGEELGVRFIFPHAPQKCVTINMGMMMPAWYDIRRLDARYFEDEDDEGIRASESRIGALIEHEISRGIDASRIVVAGFSQGGAIALQTGLRYPRRLAGILALSTCLPLRQTLEVEVSDANRGLPIFFAHGTFDPVIPFVAAEESKAALEEHGYNVDWHAYPMEHSSCLEEFRDAASWLRRVLKSEETDSREAK